MVSSSPMLRKCFSRGGGGAGGGGLLGDALGELHAHEGILPPVDGDRTEVAPLVADRARLQRYVLEPETPAELRGGCELDQPAPGEELATQRGRQPGGAEPTAPHREQLLEAGLAGGEEEVRQGVVDPVGA